MQRTPGWVNLAKPALELSGLALFVALFDGKPFATHDAPAADPPPVTAAPETADDAWAFVREEGVAVRYYRARDSQGELYAGFFEDGRMRLADDRGHRFAGMLVGERADVLELRTERWSEAIVRTTPDGQPEVEMRGGALAGRVFLCETAEE